MSKKYVPSGYQIINLDVEVTETGEPEEITPTTEDEKELHKILSSSEIKKPILISIKVLNKDTTNVFKCIDFPVIEWDSVNELWVLFFGESSGAASSFLITTSGDKLSIQLNEVV